MQGEKILGIIFVRFGKIIFQVCRAWHWHPNSPPRPGEAPHPAPSARKSVIRLHRKLPSVPPASTQEVSEGTTTRRPALGRLPTPPPLPENLLLGLHRKLPSAPPASTQEVRNPKIGQQLGAQPTPRFRGMLDAPLDALLDALLDAMFDPWPPFTFCCPQAIVNQDAGV